MSLLFGHNLQIIFVIFFSQNELSHFCGQNAYILGILCMHLLLQFYADRFETLQVFRSRSEDVHVFLGHNPKIVFLTVLCRFL